MTYNELKSLRGLDRLITYQRSKVARLEAKARSIGTSVGCERAPGVTDKVGDGVVEIISAKKELKRLESLIDERDAFINNIPDYNVRLAATLYFIDKKTWRQTAFRLGGNNTKDGVRKMCKRYFT